jgi:hypothetical protein
LLVVDCHNLMLDRLDQASDEKIMTLGEIERDKLCRGNLPRVPRATGYDPKTPGYDRLPPAAYGWGATHPYQETTPPLHAEEVGPPT